MEIATAYGVAATGSAVLIAGSLGELVVDLSSFEPSTPDRFHSVDDGSVVASRLASDRGVAEIVISRSVHAIWRELEGRRRLWPVMSSIGTEHLEVLSRSAGRDGRGVSVDDVDEYAAGEIDRERRWVRPSTR